MPKTVSGIESIINSAISLPMVKVDREDFLTKQLHKIVSLRTLQNALRNGTIQAKIPQNVLDYLAKNAVKLETTKVTAISTAAGILGGPAMLVTVPADLTQFYAHVFRIAQKLAYIYGWKSFDAYDDGMENVLTLFLGVMSGVSLAEKAHMRVAVANAPKIGARVAAKPLTKGALYPIIKKIVAALGGKLTKPIVGQAVAKGVPIISGVFSGCMTIATFAPMANKLKIYLSKLSQMSVEDFAEVLKDGIIFDEPVENENVIYVAEESHKEDNE